MRLALSIVGFLIMTGVIVTVHELGHFWVARRLGFKVQRFSVGFGTPLCKRIGADGTEYVIAWIPLGGYVKFFDLDEELPKELLLRAFACRPAWQRLLVSVAGPASNFLLAIALFWILFMWGVPQWRPFIGNIVPGSYAALAGLQAGDEVLEVDGKSTPSVQAALFAMIGSLVDDGRISLRVRSAKAVERQTELSVPDREQRKRMTLPDEFLSSIGFEFSAPPRGVSGTAIVRLNPLAALTQSAAQTWEISALTCKMVWHMLAGHASAQGVSGPIGMADAAGESLRMGLKPFITFIAVISISLGLLNLLPVPLLDGGQMVYQFIELVKGSPVSPGVQWLGQTLSIAIIILMVWLGLTNDLARVFG
jgi:regulator of sigma E protease